MDEEDSGEFEAEQKERVLAVEVVKCSRSQGDERFVRLRELAEGVLSDVGQTDGTPSLSAVLVACACGSKELLAEVKGLGFGRVKDGPPPLLVACAYGHESIVEVLLQQGADVEEVWDGETTRFSFDSELGLADRELCRTALAACLANGHVKLAWKLLSYGILLSEESQQRPDCAEALKELLSGRDRLMVGKGKSKTEANRPMEEVQIFWNDIGLRSVTADWLSGVSVGGTTDVNLSNNELRELPAAIFADMPNLQTLNVSLNLLESLPGSESLAKCTLLSEVNIARNKLTSLPSCIVHLPRLTRLICANNQLSDLPAERWLCQDLLILDIGHNKLESLPMAVSDLPQLMELVANNNRLTSLPEKWASSKMRKVNLSGNRLTELPSGLSSDWFQLDQLNLSHNEFSSLDSVCTFVRLTVLEMSHNRLAQLPAASAWRCSSLSKLDLSFNELDSQSTVLLLPEDDDDDLEAKKRRLSDWEMLSDTFDVEEIGGEIGELVFPAMFAGCLTYLHLNNNKLKSIPPSLSRLTSLVRLDLSHNHGLGYLICSLGNLKNCFELGLRGLEISNVPRELLPGSQSGGTRRTLAYLRAQLRQSVPFNRMKLMVVGLQGRGKTSLLARLRGDPLPQNVSTVGVKVNEWVLGPEQNSSRFGRSLRALSLSDPATDQPVVFSTWDMAGQEVYYATHQCFLSANTLYLAVWDLTLGLTGVANLRTWLVNIQARAPGSSVIIVGTHLDQIPKDVVKTKVDTLRRAVRDTYYEQKGYPKIVDIREVSCVSGEGLATLQKSIRTITRQLLDPDSKEKLVDRKVPSSYVKLLDAVEQKAQELRSQRKPPILTNAQFVKLVESVPGNDIHDPEEVALAARFLHENGVLLHFEEQLNALNDIYFVDPAWLCDLLAEVVTVRERQSFIRGGLLRRKDVDFIFSQRRHEAAFIPQYLQLLEHFEIALSLGNECLLVPSMLPAESPCLHLPTWLVEGLNGAEMMQVQRIYNMAYVPSGFWSRLIARFLANLDRSGFTTLSQVATELSPPEMQVPVHPSNRPRSETDILRRKVLLWAEGFAVRWDSGSFVISSELDTSRSNSLDDDRCSVAMKVWSVVDDFSAIAFLVDQVEALIDEWFPGLSDLDMQGEPLVQRTVPCRLPSLDSNGGGSSLDGGGSSLDGHLVKIALQSCALAVLHGDFGTYRNNGLALRKLTPELLLADLPSHLLLRKHQFNFNPVRENLLGSGGAGAVYRASYAGQPVAVKQMNVPIRAAGIVEVDQLRTWEELSGEDFELLQAGENALQLLRQLRQEVSMLRELHHPCVVRLIGVQLHPAAFALELAPGGSLQGVLEAETDKHSPASVGSLIGPVLGHVLSSRIALQVVHALQYLHALSIVYRDLKSDNVLVWNLDPSQAINVKLSDYGISRYATPAGLKGEEGTPGFMAPEMIRHRGNSVAYDEKVDVFAFAMLLYELLTGGRPFAELGSASDINRAVLAGQRPDVHRHIASSDMPAIQALMSVCWDVMSSLRPSATHLADQLETVQPFLQRQCSPYSADSDADEKVNCLAGWSERHPGNGSHSWLLDKQQEGCERRKCLQHIVWLSSQDPNARYLSVFQACHGRMLVENHICKGGRVRCMEQVNGQMWVGTEASEIEVWALTMDGDESATIALEHRYKTTANVLCMVVDEREPGCRVLAALMNGTIHELTLEQRDKDDDTKEESGDWLSAGDPVQVDAVIRCMVLVSGLGIKGPHELWCAAGNTLLILDAAYLSVQHQLQVFDQQRASLAQLVSNGALVWGIDRRLPIVSVFSVKDHCLLGVLDCSQPNPNVLKCVWTKPDRHGSLQLAADQRGGSASPRRRSANVVDSSMQAEIAAARLSRLSIADGDAQQKLQLPDAVATAVYCIRSRSSRSEQRATSLSLAADCLWIARGSGDILVVPATSETTPLLAHLVPLQAKKSELSGYSDQLLTVAGGDYVFTFVRLEPQVVTPSTNVQQLLLVWGASSHAQLKSFYDYVKALNAEERKALQK